MKHPALRSAVASLVLLSASWAHADSNWYFGLGGGYSRIKFYGADFSFGNSNIDESKKEFDGGYRIALGYQFNRSWALEAHYVTLGKFFYSYADRTTGNSAEYSYKVTGFGLSVAPAIPLGSSFSIFGRLGAFFSQARRTVSDDSGPLGVSQGAAGDTSQTSLLAGVGMQLKIDEDMDVRLEYENYGRVGNAGFVGDAAHPGRANAQMISVNGIFRF